PVEQSEHFFFQDAPDDLQAVAGVLREMFDAELSLAHEMRKITAGGADDDAWDLRLKDGGGTHQAGLVRAVDDAVAQIRSAEGLAGIVHGVHFGVGKDGFFGRFAAPVAGDHLAFARYDGADWQFPRSLGLTCFLDGKLHQSFVQTCSVSLQRQYPFSMRPSDLRREQPGASKAAPPDHGQTLGARST